MNKIAVFCDKLVRWTIYVLVFLLPTFFLPWTFESLEFNKQNLLVVLTFIAALAWLGKMIASRQAFFRKSFLNILALLYLLIYTLSTLFSADRFKSLLGSSGVEKEGLITVFCFIVLYFVIINNAREVKAIKNLIYCLLGGAALVSVFSLVGFLGLLPAILVPSRALNTVGTLSAFGIFLSAMFMLAAPLFLEAEPGVPGKKKFVWKILLAVFAVLMLFLLATIDNWMVWASFTPALALLLAYLVLRAHEIKKLGWMAVPMAGLVLAILFFFIRTPIVLNLPAEIMPSFSASGEITKQTLEESPLLGSGPATFSFDYAKYKPDGVNQTALWDVKFDRSASRVLTMAATTGLFGLISWLFLVIFVGVAAIARVAKEKTGQLWLYEIGLVSSWLLLLIAKFLYSSNLTLEFTFWVLTALLAVLSAQKFWEVTLERAPRVSLALSFLLTLGIVCLVSSFYLVGQRYAADAKFGQAVLALTKGEELEKSTDLFNRAAGLNRWNDAYLVNLSQNLLAEINQEITKEPTEEGAKKLQDLIAADINVAKRATEISPNNSTNWATLASVYQSIMAIIPGADGWAIDSWNRAIELEPGNPYFYTELGKIYTNTADLIAPNLGSKDETVKKDAEAKVKDNLVKAEEQFGKAISSKGDYAPAHFELAMVYSRQGKIKEAIGKLEVIQANIPNDIGVAFQLGLLYAQNKEIEKSIAQLEGAIKLAPQFANARWYLAALYEEQGKKDLAIAQLEEILKTNTDNETVKQKIEALKAPPAPETPPEMPEPLPEAPKQ